ncbi:MAG TPA: hypothetical protein VF808_09505 [Ktedonobacterales bacterium]
MRGRLLIHSGRRAALVAVGLALAWALVALAAPVASADGSAGAVAGVLTNGTSGKAVAGQKVTLQLVIGSSIHDLASTVTSATGAFTFARVDSSPATLGGQWAVYTSYQGGMYNSATLTVKSGETVDASFDLYDATHDSSNLRISNVTLLARPPDAIHGLIGVAEFVTIENTGKTAFVGQTQSAMTGAMPPLLRFALPADAINLSPGGGFANAQILQIDTGFAATATVPPGATAFAFAFQMPYTGTAVSIPFKAIYPAAQVVALVPLSMLAHDTSGFAAQGIVNTFGERYQVYTASNLPHDSQVTLNLYQLPQAGQRLDLNAAGLLWLAGGLAALLALLAGLYLWRGGLGAVLGLVPVAGMKHENGAPDQHGVERKRLLEQILDVRRRHTRGDLSYAQSARDENVLRGRLRAILEETPVAPEAVTPGPATAAALPDAAAGLTEPAPGQRGGGR